MRRKKAKILDASVALGVSAGRDMISSGSWSPFFSLNISGFRLNGDKKWVTCILVYSTVAGKMVRSGSEIPVLAQGAAMMTLSKKASESSGFSFEIERDRIRTDPFTEFMISMTSHEGCTSASEVAMMSFISWLLLSFSRNDEDISKFNVQFR